MCQDWGKSFYCNTLLPCPNPCWNENRFSSVLICIWRSFFHLNKTEHCDQSLLVLACHAQIQIHWEPAMHFRTFHILQYILRHRQCIRSTTVVLSHKNQYAKDYYHVLFPISPKVYVLFSYLSVVAALPDFNRIGFFTCLNLLKILQTCILLIFCCFVIR